MYVIFNWTPSKNHAITSHMTNETQTCQCLRCGYVWTPYRKRDSLGRPNRKTSRRCARCRNARWNKSYVRKISFAVMNPGSPYYVPEFPSIASTFKISVGVKNPASTVAVQGSTKKDKKTK